MKKTLLVLVCVSVTVFVPAMPCAAQSPQRVATSDLKRTPFAMDGLTLTLKKLDGYVFSSHDIRDVGVGFVVVRLENSSAEFATFVSSRLVIVGKDGKQASVGYERRTGDRVTAGEVRLAPGAHVEVQYNLTQRVHFPAKLYHGDKLLAEITN